MTKGELLEGLDSVPWDKEVQILVCLPDDREVVVPIKNLVREYRADFLIECEVVNLDEAPAHYGRE